MIWTKVRRSPWRARRWQGCPRTEMACRVAEAIGMLDGRGSSDDDEDRARPPGRSMRTGPAPSGHPPFHDAVRADEFVNIHRPTLPA